jgi:glycine dehydrogenase
VREHLAPFLPGDPLGEGTTHAVASAPQGSAGVLPITYAYIAMMGPDGLRAATEGALIAANYVAKRLADTYPVLYAGESGLVAHECILDLRPLTKRTGVTVDDVAKRLVDYGFHAPTMSFPVPGTLMVEPTESEPKEELDRFCDAMVAIRGEIQEVLDGSADRQNNVLKNAPHTAGLIAGDAWPYPYSREKAAYPLPSLRADKFWPASARVNNAYGDRNLVCACPPVEEYSDAVAGKTA